MSKILPLTLLVGVLVAVIMAVPPSHEEQKKIFNECKEQEKASEDDIQEFMDYKVPQSPKAKCVLACMHEKSKLVVNGKINIDALKGPDMKDGESVKPAGSVAAALNECVSITDPDRCELSFKLAQCLSKVSSAGAPVMVKN